MSEKADLVRLTYVSAHDLPTDAGDLAAIKRVAT